MKNSISNITFFGRELFNFMIKYIHHFCAAFNEQIQGLPALRMLQQRFDGMVTPFTIKTYCHENTLLQTRMAAAHVRPYNPGANRHPFCLDD
ncbi:MAG: hypothetical protein JST26_03040 [Bacteroidetes bacterium]|nr:hypothetical protein [Bacteroidota bacterium]